jgi:hypothetical protein
MNIVKNKTFTAKAVIGLVRGYSQDSISTTEFKKVLQDAQKKIYQHYGIGLSVKSTNCEIIFLGQEEPSIDLQIIQYPKFPQTEEILKKMFLALIEMMMLELDQNRVVIVFSDETIMLEQLDTIDPNIQY